MQNVQNTRRSAWRSALAMVAMSFSLGIVPGQLAASSLRDVNSLALQCRSGKQRACIDLAKVAMEDKSASVRLAAAQQLTDQPSLGKIATESKDASVRRDAALKLNDQPLLERIAAEDKDADVRLAVAGKVAEQKRAAEARAASARIAAAAKLADEAWAGVNCLERDSLSRFLAAFPESPHASEAKLALAAAERFNAIQSKESVPEYVIPFQKLGGKWNDWKRYNLGLGVVGYLAKPERLPNGQSIVSIGYFPPFTGGKTPGYRTMAMDNDSVPVIPSADGSIAAFKTGGVQYGWVGGFTVTTPGDNPVVFGVLNGVGLVYLAGVAEIREPDGSLVSLPKKKP
jgi:hypothetical protein